MIQFNYDLNSPGTLFYILMIKEIDRSSNSVEKTVHFKPVPATPTGKCAYGRLFLSFGPRERRYYGNIFCNFLVEPQ